MSLQRLVINTSLSADGFKSWCDLAPGKLPALQNLVNYLSAISGGSQSASIDINVAAVQAAGSLTVATGGSVAAQACTVCNVTLTGRASDPAANEFVVSATAATQATNMAAAINASADLAGKVTAEASSGVVTITAVVPGVLGNGFEISAGNLANVTAGVFEDGADGTAYSIDLS